MGGEESSTRTGNHSSAHPLARLVRGRTLPTTDSYRAALALILEAEAEAEVGVGGVGALESRSTDPKLL